MAVYAYLLVLSIVFLHTIKLSRLNLVCTFDFYQNDFVIFSFNQHMTPTDSVRLALGKCNKSDKTFNIVLSYLVKHAEDIGSRLVDGEQYNLPLVMGEISEA